MNTDVVSDLLVKTVGKLHSGIAARRTCSPSAHGIGTCSSEHYKGNRLLILTRLENILVRPLHSLPQCRQCIEQTIQLVARETAQIQPAIGEQSIRQAQRHTDFAPKRQDSCSLFRRCICAFVAAKPEITAMCFILEFLYSLRHDQTLTRIAEDGDGAAAAPDAVNQAEAASLNPCLRLLPTVLYCY